MSGARTLWDEFSDGRIKRYVQSARLSGSQRGFLFIGPSSLRHISIRELVRAALHSEADVWLSELIWRDFYFMILDQFPHVAGHAFKPEYDAIQWAALAGRLCRLVSGTHRLPAGRRGDAPAQLQRLDAQPPAHGCRLVLDQRSRHRLAPRRAYFAEQLNDFDLSANNGGWQWASSSGCDAQPYFRIFNPITQSEKFDSEGKFIRRYVPELAKVSNKHIHAPWLMGRLEQEALGVVIGRDYPGPIVDHARARERTLARYAVVKKLPK
jgi:deoxyribodipyrimidine photo-lyase